MSIKFGGHEKFVLREGWLTKGLKIINNSKQNPFTDKDAVLVFGVGTNMVKAIRYYLNIANLIKEDKNICELNIETGINTLLKYDPYFEDNFSYYIYHYFLATNVLRKTLFYIMFNNIEQRIFTKEELIKCMKDILYANNEKFKEEQIKNDINVILSIYSRDNENYNPEDTYISPLTYLKLIKKIDKNTYQKTNENIQELSALLVLYSIENCLFNGEEGISLNDLLIREKSPVKIFNLTKDQLYRFIDILRKNGFVRYDATAGLNMIYIEQVVTIQDVIKEHYK